MYVDGLCLFVGVDNARFAPVERHSDTGLCRSAKSEDGHGFGMRAAQAIARKYTGELVIELPEGGFSVSTALLMKK